MDSVRTVNNKNPRETANTLSVVVWWWTVGLLKKGCRKILGLEDLYEPLATDRSNILGDRLEAKWKAEVIKAKDSDHHPSLLKTIFITFLPEYLMLGCLHILNEFVLRFGIPILLGALLQYFKPNSTTTYNAALIFAGGISLASLINAITANHALYGAIYLGGRIRIAVVSVIYRKALRLSKTALGETASSKVVNLVANDVNRFCFVSIYIHYMWSAPLSAMIITYLLYSQAGWTGLIGMAPLFCIVPIQAYAGKLTSRFRLQTAMKTDERVRLMNEIISGVQLIKMYAWEKPFCALVVLARRLELKVVKKNGYLRGIHMCLNLFTARFALYCTLLAMMLSNDSLRPEKVFVFASYFNMLALTMSGKFIRGVDEIAECLVAVGRLQSFLLSKEFQRSNVTNNMLLSQSGKITGPLTSSVTWNKDHPKITDVERKDNSWGVKLNNVSAKWDLSSSDNTLDDVSFKVGKGKLCVVIGTVGSGKSSLLSTLLGEINLTHGNVQVNGGVSYASQEAWVFGATVKQNILFGLEFDRHRYRRVVEVCALKKDFSQFPYGDQTIVGERGSSLSGGQKARINLARAVYRQADIYLLDDPLSAVDAHVGKHLFEECLQKYLKNKTRILATHQLQYIKAADSIIVLDQGKIHQYPNYHDFLNVHPEYKSVISEDKTKQTNDDSLSARETIKSNRKASLSSIRSEEETDDEIDGKSDLNNLAGFIEDSSRGIVKGNLTAKYFRTGSGIFLFSTMMILFVVTQIATSLNDFFIPKLLTVDEPRTPDSNLHVHKFKTTNGSKIISEEDILPQQFYVYVYSSIVASIFIFAIIRSFTFYTICMRSSQRLHDLAFGALIRASMRFFDTNPSGRILNRFFKDIGAIDELLPKAMLDAIQNILCMVGSLVLTCTVNPIFLIPILVMTGIFYFIRVVFLRTSKNINRLEGMTRAPVFTHLNATLDGISTIRACRAQKILKKEFDMYQDIHTSSWFMFISSNTAFSFSLDFLCFLFITLVTFSFLLLKKSFSGGEVGLAITQVITLTGMVQDAMRRSAEVSNQMMSVERVLEYSQIEPECSSQVQYLIDKKPNKKSNLTKNSLSKVPENWPSKGCIEFKNVSLRYSADDLPVLKGLNLLIKSGEKIGIVGRTGAGKSSLISAFFRLAKVEGIIEIDGLDTKDISLEDLRLNISIIPQDPVLFSGTLRKNLDPFQEYSDELIWDVLEKVELKNAVIATGKGLDHRVLDKGSNYSVGQRQLICLARAIMRNNKILVMDEATANVDPQTDSLIQRTIQTQFAKCTVLAIAHRLNTIMDSDKVLVMNHGQIEEFDHPFVLLSKENSQLTALTKETGSSMYQQLYKVACESYKLKNSKSCENSRKLSL